MQQINHVRISGIMRLANQLKGEDDKETILRKNRQINNFLSVVRKGVKKFMDKTPRKANYNSTGAK